MRKFCVLYMPTRPQAALACPYILMFGRHALMQIMRVIHAVIRYRSLWHIPTFFYTLIPSSRVVGEDFVAEDGAVEVEVDFGGLDAFVAEHLLDGAQIGAPFEQVSRK